MSPQDKFMYVLEKHDSLPFAIIDRSAAWRRLRDAMSEMKEGEWIRVVVPEEYQGEENTKKAARFLENVRSGGVYAFYVAIGGDKQPYVYQTHLERTEDGLPIAIWVGKQERKTKNS